MRPVGTAFLFILVSICLCSAQQSPPANGVGLGNAHLSSGTVNSGGISMSPNQNSVDTGTMGLANGNTGTSGMAGAPPASDASSVNSEGTLGFGYFRAQAFVPAEPRGGTDAARTK
jgi:hypothetical protein